MSERINIQEILKKHGITFGSGEAPFRAVRSNQNQLDNAIKEICEAVVDKCADVAETRIPDPRKYETEVKVDEDSILNVKTLIDYD